MDYDAELHDYIFNDNSYAGYIYGDSRERWADGTFVYTSSTVSVTGDILQTLNTRYKLVNTTNKGNN